MQFILPSTNDVLRHLLLVVYFLFICLSEWTTSVFQNWHCFHTSYIIFISFSMVGRTLIASSKRFISQDTQCRCRIFKVFPCRPVRTLYSPTKWRCHITACEGMNSRQSCTFITTKWLRHVYNGCCIKVSECFPVAKASHKRSQSNFRAIVVLTTTTFASTVLGVILSDHMLNCMRDMYKHPCVCLIIMCIAD